MFGELQAKSLRLQMFEGMLDKNMEWYDLRQDGVGALMIRIQTQIRELQLAVSQPLGFLTYEVIGVGAALGLAFYFSWKLTLVIISTFPIAGALLYFVSLKLGPAIESQKRELTQASKYANTAITNINTVKAYNGQDQEVWQYESTIKRVAISYMIQARTNALQHAIIKFMMIALFVEGFWFGLYLVNRGVDPGHVLTTFYACLNALQAVEVVLPQWLVLTKGMSAGATLETIMIQMRNGRKITTMTGSCKPKSCLGDIEINKVSFTYPVNPQQTILNKANFFFPASETTFIVGSSGSGKSTLGSLLMKYYEPSRGEILLDGNPLHILDPDWLRQNVSLVQQKSVLFNETILQNIAFGRELAPTTDDIVEACQAADLEDTLKALPLGLETVAMSGGQALSGGQQQRIVIARARLRNSPILILDEATSALDQTSRERVMTEIRKWRKGKTTIIITHDVSQIHDNEYVYVLQAGTVVQEGYRSNLADRQFGAFAALVAAAQTPLIPFADQRRSSAPTSPATPSKSSFDELLHLNWNHVSRPFGMPNLSPRTGTSVNVRNSLLLSVGATQADSTWNKNIWSSPVISDEGSFSPRWSTSTRFASPESLSSRFSRAFPTISNTIDSTFNDLEGANKSLSQPEGAVNPNPKGNRGEGFKHLPELELPRLELPDLDRPEHEPPFPVDLSPPLLPLKKPASLSLIFQTVWPNLNWRDRSCLVLGFLAALIVGASTPAFAYVFTQLLEVYYLPSNRGMEALKWALILLGIGVVDAVSVFSMHYALEHSGQAWVNKLRVEALKRILRQPRSWFDKERNSAANLNAYLDRNAEEMRNLIGRFAGPIFTTFWMLGISLVWSMVISWKLTLVAVACGPAMYVLIQVFNLVSGKWEEKCNKASEHTGSIFTETFSNIRVVRALTLESYFKRKYENAAVDTYKIGMSRAIYTGAFFGLGDTMSYLLTASVFYYGAVIITSGQLDVTTVLQVVNLLMFGIANAMAMLMLVPQLSSSRTAATYMLHLANLPLHNTPETMGKKRLKSPFPIAFSNLSFTYPLQRKPILQNISLNFQPGTCTGIVGPSGSGKSTISSLLLGLYTPNPAPVDKLAPLSFAGVPITQCNMASLRNQISIVAQQPLLFPCSVLSNIIYGLPEGSSYANLNSAMQAARDAGIHDFIMSLPNCYATIVGEGGMSVSSGQAQRIAIARALVRRPRILILDEATSALDAISAEAIRQTVRLLIQRGKDARDGGVAVIIITHAVEMMRICDQIVMIENGKMVESGGFDELRSKDGAFAGLIGSKSATKGDAKGLGIERIASPWKARTRQNWFRQTSY
ncbi:P-loop containing nucleoside triphosphate hydrolase protein [Mollisia scopiformis]|uniref:p-loop containing nucleoside triphosphate hydrolase protein n=1 Tax=Mollisia scopiformis TaxID=149040 RepID=A0A194XFC8_MOLSC|nr:P-loop containing nucleoside triphosphate hydrolase protein [Mollisia scopiformis]KUJ18851.1 P-loop containing nucleoside triphosphate hydrolase protein [Mollisia scopiformis]